ncbi:Aste57867_10117 [Aphanomyces stellatus]|uniref:Aste57867_10117 protein n=1 Tax=Aphanomyces stellatus TaxID=120398 RepID=A0A485KQ12_9STRA|nr:hypothetical protein As57867_010078 [Aphanomyces stellatus]VFT86993.1 Aste57867_10117 [Aphanomyces stellatus]
MKTKGIFLLLGAALMNAVVADGTGNGGYTWQDEVASAEGGGGLVLSHDGTRYLAPTDCSVGECPHGGCFFHDCSTTVTCQGGLCEFFNCYEPSCGGGVCTMVNADGGSCSGGLCNYVTPRRSLTEGFCAGGLCRLDGKDHVASFSRSLSERRAAAHHDRSCANDDATHAARNDDSSPSISPE